MESDLSYSPVDPSVYVGMDDDLLAQALAAQGAKLGAAELLSSHPHLFSHGAVLLTSQTLDTMANVVAAVERVVALAAYQELALRDAHVHARIATRARGVFLGFDFHLANEGPQLIEINTNAGGALLNTLLRRAQRACCEPVAAALGLGEDDTTARLLAMFRAEHALARGEQPLRAVAIVDDNPKTQYLYPEFLLFERLFITAGIQAVVCDVAELEIVDGALVARGLTVDLVYNRCTDFSLAAPEHAALARAYREDLAVVTPHPRAHALYADKRRLCLLSDVQALRDLGVAPADCELLAEHVPTTRVVDPAERDALWNERKTLFFKPQSGYGSKAAYRGDKLTRSVFERLLGEPYVAQRLVPPSTQRFGVGEQMRTLKVDVRNFVYDGAVQLVCARLYEGQTTNFRTPGGGFAPAYRLPPHAVSPPLPSDGSSCCA